MRELAVTMCMVCVLPLLTSSEYSSRDKCKCCQGPSGVAGIPGLPGQAGRDGRLGEKGDEGSKGAFGNKGDRGEKGNIGEDGHRGRKGKKGECGTKGETGSRGSKGDRGFLGYKGDRGHQGEPAKPIPNVAFSAVRRRKLGPVLETTTITFTEVFTNIGESFDEYTSHFICKINATYFFTVHVVGNPGGNMEVWIMLNNKHMVAMAADKRAGYGTGSNSIILTLVAEDHVWLQLQPKGSIMNDYSTFTGYLLFLTN